MGFMLMYDGSDNLTPINCILRAKQKTELPCIYFFVVVVVYPKQKMESDQQARCVLALGQPGKGISNLYPSVDRLGLD